MGLVKTNFFPAINRDDGLFGHMTPQPWRGSQILQLTPPQAPVLLDYDDPKHESKLQENIQLILLFYVCRWANQGLDFLTVACDPKTLTTLSEAEFQVKSTQQ